MRRCFFLILIGLVALTSCMQEEQKTSRLVELGGYKGYQYVYNDPEVTDERVEEIIQLRHAAYAITKYDITNRDVIQTGDYVKVDYCLYGKDEPTVVSGAEFQVGGGVFLPDLENQLVGKKINVAYNLEVDIPKEYSDCQIAGKTVEIDITVKRLYRYGRSEMTDEYFKDIGYASYEKCFDAVKKELLYEENYWERERVCGELLAQIAADSLFDLAENEVDVKYEKILDDSKYSAKVAEMAWFDYILKEENFSSVDEYLLHLREQAENAIKIELVKEELIRIAQIDPSDEEVKKMALEKYSYSKGQLEMGEQVRENVIKQLLYDFLLENSVRIN